MDDSKGQFFAELTRNRPRSQASKTPSRQPKDCSLEPLEEHLPPGLDNFNQNWKDMVQIFGHLNILVPDLYQIMREFIGNYENIRFVASDTIVAPISESSGWTGAVGFTSFETCSCRWTVHMPIVRSMGKAIVLGITRENFRADHYNAHDIDVRDCLYLSSNCTTGVCCTRANILPGEPFGRVQHTSKYFKDPSKIEMVVDLEQSTLCMIVDDVPLGEVWSNIPNLIRCRPYIAFMGALSDYSDVYVL